MNYIVFLRGINVGGHRKIKMTDFKSILSNKGFKNIGTYIQSGNLFLTSKESKEDISEKIKDIIKDQYQFDVPALCISQEELNSLLEKSPFKGESEKKKLYYCILDELPENDNINAFKNIDFKGDQWQINGNVLYIKYQEKLSSSNLDLKQIEKHLKVSGTVRNHNTMVKMAQFDI